MKSYRIIFYSLLVLGLSSCNLGDDGPNFHFTALQITSAELPESFDLNGTYEIKVTYVRPDGCTFFEGFDFVKEDVTVRNVVAVGSVRTDQACTAAVEEEEATFVFVVLFDEPYTFRFWQGTEDGTDEYFEVEVPVN
ncbi:hypothetical protein [Ulvibacterium marinum]|uniref:Lipoprotein n=1 Tax=Ulvibacterium marinum TaxID=2419782 RepID=A0A3B0CAF0_9FLAO|nr:hypothetical protein [Ulvibacterium marinum]RKN82713.1 hypothetical protein D7Z94_02415 [Ulvibacterium marinum]